MSSRDGDAPALDAHGDLEERDATARAPQRADGPDAVAGGAVVGGAQHVERSTARALLLRVAQEALNQAADRAADCEGVSFGIESLDCDAIVDAVLAGEDSPAWAQP